MNYYEILGVERNADENIIKKQYHKLAKEHHPDKTKGDVYKQEKFIQIQTAYSTLSNKERRYAYDMTFDEEQMFENIASFFSFNEPSYETKVHRESETITELMISLEDYCKGVNTTIKINEIVKCVLCDETGIDDYKNNTLSCSSCNGLGIDKNIPLFACGMCNGRGFAIINNVKCKECKGLGNIEKQSQKK